MSVRLSMRQRCDTKIFGRAVVATSQDLAGDSRSTIPAESAVILGGSQNSSQWSESISAKLGCFTSLRCSPFSIGRSTKKREQDKGWEVGKKLTWDRPPGNLFGICGGEIGMV
ncbi:S-adenosylmethionine synthetase 1 [Striga asiatica]|uniref:S-adenosylmethionine synthetase 1 n=1 Tax=Striga asiatica TaxID=4170 RepID=A0A5A7PUS5_STRAF|nr:S-adenosylmethionine synthetase 1 [Striga asiatica]